jgi:molybdopterin-synthase adenylyltransferase
MTPPPLDSRYRTQMRLPAMGERGQSRLSEARVAVVGVGGLGSAAASYLARAGVGTLRLIDRDVVEPSNLHRQILFDEADAREGVPKAEAARRRLAAANPEIRIESHVEHLGRGNAGELLFASSVIVDGTDNFETRFLLNDYAVREGIPWIYGAAIGTRGIVATVVPGRTSCLRCLVGAESPGPEAGCETEGVFGPLVGVVGSLQACAALRLLVEEDPIGWPGAMEVEAWEGELGRRLEAAAPDPKCPACGERRYEFLEGGKESSARTLCGREAVQLLPSTPGRRDLGEIARRLDPVGEVSRNSYLVRARLDGYTLSLFPDGRVIVFGTEDPDRARALVNRYLDGV